ncbi:hypothetical protein ACO0QE_004009 [Hanseniaspora vineae]
MEVKSELPDFLSKLCNVNLKIHHLVNVRESDFSQVRDICFVFQRQSLALNKKRPFLFTKTFSEYDFETCCSKLLKSKDDRVAQAVKTKHTDLQAPPKANYEDSCFIESFQLDQDYFVYLTSDPQQSTYRFHSLSTVNLGSEESWSFICKTPIGSKNFAHSTYRHEPLIVFVSESLLVLYTVITPDEQLWYLKKAVFDIRELDSLGLDEILKIELPKVDTPDKIYVYGQTKMMILHLEYDHTVFAKTKVRRHHFVPFHHTNYDHLRVSGLTMSSFESESSGIDAHSVKLVDCYWSPSFDSLIIKTTNNEISFSNFCQLPHSTVSSGHHLLYTKYCKSTTFYETSHKSSEILVSANFFQAIENAELIVYLTLDGLLYLVKMSCHSSNVSQTYAPLKIVDQKMVTQASIIGDSFQITMSNSSQTDNLILIACQQGVVGVANYHNVLSFNWPKELENLTICDVRLDSKCIANVTTSSGYIFELEVMKESNYLRVRKEKHLSAEFEPNSIVLDYYNIPRFYLSNNTLYDIKSLKPLQLPYVSVWFCHQHFHDAKDKWLLYTKDKKKLEFTYASDLNNILLKPDSLQKSETQPREFYVKEILLNSLNSRFSLIAVYSLPINGSQKKFVKLVIFDLLINAALREYSAASLKLPDTADLIALLPLIKVDDTPQKPKPKHAKKTGINSSSSQESSALKVQLEQVFNKCFVVCLNYRDSGKLLKNELLIFHFNEHGLVDATEKALKMQHRFTLLTGSKIAFLDKFSRNDLPPHLTENPLFITVTADGSMAQLWGIQYHPAEHRFEVVSQFGKSENTFAFVGCQEESFVPSRTFDQFKILPGPVDGTKNLIYISMLDTKSGSFQLLKYELDNNLQWLTKTEQLVFLDILTNGQHLSLNINKIVYAAESILIILVNNKKDILVVRHSFGGKKDFSLASRKKRKRYLTSLQKHCVFDLCDVSHLQKSGYSAVAEESWKITNSYGHFTSAEVVGKETQGLASMGLHLLISTSNAHTYKVKIKC